MGDTKYQSDEGVPGVTVGINHSVNITASCSISTPDIRQALNSKLGFSGTASEPRDRMRIEKVVVYK